MVRLLHTCATTLTNSQLTLTSTHSSRTCSAHTTYNHTLIWCTHSHIIIQLSLNNRFFKSLMNFFSFKPILMALP